MADSVGFQTQIASIIEILANSAVVQICRLVDDGYAALRLQMDQERDKSEREKDALRQKLRDMDMRMRIHERRLKRRLHREELRSSKGPDDDPPVVPLPFSSEDKSYQDPSKQDGALVLPLVKQEIVDKDTCNVDLKVEVNIRAECGLSTTLETFEETCPGDVLSASVTKTNAAVHPPFSPSDATTSLTSRPSQAKFNVPKPPGNTLTGSSSEVQATKTPCEDVPVSHADGALKPEIPTDSPIEDLHPSQLSAPPLSDESSADHLNNLGLDLAWMQERVNNLGAAYAVAQLGLGNTDTRYTSASFPKQGGDGSDGPPAMLFTGSPQEMAAFAASFDIATAATAPPSATLPPPTALSATTPSQWQANRSGATAAKDPVACVVCGCVLPSAAALELHQRVHTGERPYTCPHCAKSFGQPNNLRVHLLIHSGERRYHCSLCGKSFISSSHLKRHRTVHTQEKPYSCSRCGQSFSQMCSVRRHRQQSQCGL